MSLLLNTVKEPLEVLQYFLHLITLVQPCLAPNGIMFAVINDEVILAFSELTLRPLHGFFRRIEMKALVDIILKEPIQQGQPPRTDSNGF